MLAPRERSGHPSGMKLIVLAFFIALSALAETRLLYVATPGIRNYLEYGGHGVLVFDIDEGHKFVRRIPSAGLDDKGKPMNVKGICASQSLQRLYVSTIKTQIGRAHV